MVKIFQYEMFCAWPLLLPGFSWPHFVDEIAEAQGAHVTCSRSP
ncbi:unnamed protein product [Nyctereutes procyonoides]|uniref:(raccoon dog) hypothetical protein n=1 Tax=Nyctereutes procyonoides TaxID=34880 RepID=A0A811XRG0_NYCPR|nr:unnamed protein product [Nyctereutes procyonoides]